MKIQRLTKVPVLWEFAASRLPASLRVVRTSDGYGSVFGIEAKERGFRSYFSPGVATITEDCIELRYPEWFSDFEDLCRAYESATGREVTLKYWEEGADRG